MYGTLLMCKHHHREAAVPLPVSLCSTQVSIKPHSCLHNYNINDLFTVLNFISSFTVVMFTLCDVSVDCGDDKAVTAVSEETEPASISRNETVIAVISSGVSAALLCAGIILTVTCLRRRRVRKQQVMILYT